MAAAGCGSLASQQHDATTTPMSDTAIVGHMATPTEASKTSVMSWRASPGMRDATSSSLMPPVRTLSTLSMVSDVAPLMRSMI